MKFLTKRDCEQWLVDHNRRKPDEVKGLHSFSLPFPDKPYRTFYIASWIAQHLTYRKRTLLWITEYGIWPSSENLHLYYRLRQTYGDLDLLEDKPGHLFLPHESEDLASFLQLTILNGWGGYLLTALDYANAFVSHDEFIDFYSGQAEVIDEIKKALLPKP